MKRLSLIDRLLDGSLKISDKTKYSMITAAIACVHVFLVFVFLYIGSKFMVIYNIFSVAGYLLCLPLIKKNRLGWVFAFTCLEVPLHSFLAVYVAGWECGFAMYLIAIVPVSFDLSFALKNTVKGIKLSLFMGIFNAAFYISCRFYSYYTEPLYKVEKTTFVDGVYFINILCTFGLLLVYSFIFVSEINVAQANLEDKNKELVKLASVDTLTGLYNRRKMHEFLYAATDKKPFSLIMSDIDNFKKINDTYGHDCGDEALKTVSETLRKCLPEGDVVCRWGGEEFLILTRHSLDEAADIAEKIRAEVEKNRITFDGKEINITLTLGVAQYDPESTVDKAITAADGNLYIGKNSGKNRVVK